MNMFHAMITGYQHFQRKGTKSDLKHLRSMISDEIDSKYASKSTANPYIVKLFHHFSVSVDHCFINLGWMNVEVVQAHKRPNYGYKIFRSLFFKDNNDDLLNINYLFSFLTNLESCAIFNNVYGRYDPSLLIAESFMLSLLSTIKMVNSHKTLSKSFKEFVLVNPKFRELDNIKNVIKEYGQLFIENGWTLSESTYKQPARHGQCEAVFINKTV